ncbi:hypothetical protein OC846_004535 [Tilletia horrida]|uniref:Mid2 domain-containing protein n=1 Tax=Tilletia horrida TaxID=155126 RepID=A0AAN6GQN8_9BASI|nr:hypothetical protein OC845_004694 [Tilletia horrida]KAK0548286.1 hypothetical protein OC846_004535 [Tilletia horrida]
MPRQTSRRVRSATLFLSLAVALLTVPASALGPHGTGGPPAGFTSFLSSLLASIASNTDRTSTSSSTSTSAPTATSSTASGSITSAPTSAPTSTPSASPVNVQASGGSSSNAGPIVGGVVGGVAIILLGIIAFYLARRQSQSATSQSTEWDGGEHGQDEGSATEQPRHHQQQEQQHPPSTPSAISAPDSLATSPLREISDMNGDMVSPSATIPPPPAYVPSDVGGSGASSRGGGSGSSSTALRGAEWERIVPTMTTMTMASEAGAIRAPCAISDKNQHTFLLHTHRVPAEKPVLEHNHPMPQDKV